MIGIAAGLGLAAMGLAVATWGDKPAGASSTVTSGAAEPEKPAPGALECRFESQEAAAFSFESSATLDAASAPRAEDHFRGLLSWVIVAS